jgi:hypothetical protein
MSLQTTPALIDSQIAKLAAAAERLSKHLPQFEPKPHNTKKKVCKELEVGRRRPPQCLQISFSVGDVDAGERSSSYGRNSQIRRHLRTFRLQKKTRETTDVARGVRQRSGRSNLPLHSCFIDAKRRAFPLGAPGGQRFGLLLFQNSVICFVRVSDRSTIILTNFRLSTMYMNKSLIQDRDVLDARCSPRIISNDVDGVVAKKPKLETNSDGDDHRQVSQQNRQKPSSQLTINLED